jgi:hypothetical protein
MILLGDFNALSTQLPNFYYSKMKGGLIYMGAAR